MSKLCLEEWLYETGVEKDEMVFERTYSKETNKPVVKMGRKYVDGDEKKALLVSLLEDNILKMMNYLSNMRILSRSQESTESGNGSKTI